MKPALAFAFVLAATPVAWAQTTTGQTTTAPAPAAESTTAETTAARSERPDDLVRFPSLTGESRYAGTDATHLDYVNPDAPKGGRLNSTVSGTFDSFNPFIVRGTPAAGFNYQGGVIYDTLMEQSLQEPSTSYPLIADGLTFPDDFSSATYYLNPNAKFHDGDPIDAEDVVWSFEQLKANYPLYNKYYGNVTRAVAEAPDRVRFEFEVKNNRELPVILGDMPVLPKHWWTAEGRDIAQPTLEKPLGSGPYRVKSFEPGASITWERVPDYWGADTFTRIGRFNFDELRYTYFGGSDAEWQAFQKGGFEDIRTENRSQKWAEGYTFPAAVAGDVKKEELERLAGHYMQGWAMNQRRDKFKDPKVREALTYVFDFESANRNLFYGLYDRPTSYFGGEELPSKGVPQGAELEVLKDLDAKHPGALPPEVLTEEWKPVVFEDRRATRRNLGEALRLLQEAGYQSKGGKLVGPDGKPFTVEFLTFDPSSQRVIKPFQDNLRRLGIQANIHQVDTTQYIERLRNFDFDVTTVGGQIAQSQSPGNEQRDYWTSTAADTPGSQNFFGLKNPAVDDLVERIILAKDREELVMLTNALDRILLHLDLVVPQWGKNTAWLAYWDKFERPERQPEYVGADTFSWWIDTERERELEAKY